MNKVMSFLGIFTLVLLFFIMYPPTNSNGASSCQDNGTCFDLCKEPGQVACSYALCDDDIGTELCKSAGEEGDCTGDMPCLD